MTLGTQNNFTDQVQPTDSNLEKWYERNNFAALTARLGSDWLGQIAYSVYGSPNDVSPTGYELALAGAYRGQNLLGGLAPQLKVAKPTDRGGVYTELVATPGLTLLDDAAYPITLGVPLTARHRLRRLSRLRCRHDRLRRCGTFRLGAARVHAFRLRQLEVQRRGRSDPAGG